MALSGQSLSSASAAGPGTAIMFDEPRAVLAQVTYVGGGGFNVVFEGTLDGVNWAIFQQYNNSIEGSYLAPNAGALVMGVRATLSVPLTLGTISVFFSAAEF